MKIKALWGFQGNGDVLKGSAGGRVRAGQVFDDVPDEYAHQLIGKGLAEAVDGKEKPSPTPRSTKPAAPKEAA